MSLRRCDTEHLREYPDCYEECDHDKCVGTETESNVKVAVTMKVSLERMKDLLTDALEGGSNYWYIIKDYRLPAGKTVKDFEFPHNDIPFAEGGAALIGDLEDESVTPKWLDLPALIKGLRVMARKYPRHFTDFINENDDAITADVYLQCCLFGEVIYG